MNRPDDSWCPAKIVWLSVKIKDCQSLVAQQEVKSFHKGRAKQDGLNFYSFFGKYPGQITAESTSPRSLRFIGQPNRSGCLQR
jgi:hypothetical protein